MLPFGYSRMVSVTVAVPKFLEESGFLNATQNDSACAGRFARVSVGLAEGWLAEPGSQPTADDIAARLRDVSATEPYTVPISIFDEVLGVCRRLGIDP